MVQSFLFFLVLLASVDSQIMSEIHRRVPICLSNSVRRSALDTNSSFNKKFDLKDPDNSWLTKIYIPVEEQKFDSRPTVVLIHGFNYFNGFLVNIPKTFERGKFFYISEMFKKYHDVNVVNVYWLTNFWLGYKISVAQMDYTGIRVADYLHRKLGDREDLWNELTIIGHSLGGKMGEGRVSC
jgi:hypothetical protein